MESNLGTPKPSLMWQLTPLHIPGTDNQPYKTELVISREEDGSCEKINWWHAPDDIGERALPHNHPWAFESQVIHGLLIEERWVLVDGVWQMSTLTHKKGNHYFMAADQYHRVIGVQIGTVTRMSCDRREHDWTYLDPRTGEIIPVPPYDEGYEKRLRDNNKFLH